MSQACTTLASAWVWDDESEDEVVTTQELNTLDALEHAAQASRECACDAHNTQRTCVSDAVVIINNQPGDLEDFGTVANRLVIKRTLTVTQLAASEACQQELAYRLSAGQPEARCARCALHVHTSVHTARERMHARRTPRA